MEAKETFKYYGKIDASRLKIIVESSPLDWDEFPYRQKTFACFSDTKTIPIIYLNIWDDLPYPMYNKSFYESCDCLLAISKQTENINHCVLGAEVAADKVIKYVPHGINENFFFPITTEHPEYLTLQEFKKQIFKGKEYEFVLLYNARNIRRKCTADLMLAWKIFVDELPEDKAKKCALLLHTQPIDENGTDLFAVRDMLFGNEEKYNIIFEQGRYPSNIMNLLYKILLISIILIVFYSYFMIMLQKN